MTHNLSLKDAWSGVADCQNCELRRSALFAGLTLEDFQHVHDPIIQVALKPGEVLYRDGEKGSRLFTLRHGLIKLVRYLPDGNQRIVRLVRSADTLGLEALLGQPYEHNAIAIQDCELCCLPAGLVNDLSERNPDLYRELLQRWQHALASADSWLTDLSTGSARQRVARLILHLAEQDEPHRCQLLGREDIGAMLGITTETASRNIAEFRRKGWLTETGHNEYLADVAAISADLGE